MDSALFLFIEIGCQWWLCHFQANTYNKHVKPMCIGRQHYYVLYPHINVWWMLYWQLGNQYTLFGLLFPRLFRITKREIELHIFV